eukprot:tig00000889_g5323.t1
MGIYVRQPRSCVPRLRIRCLENKPQLSTSAKKALRCTEDACRGAMMLLASGQQARAAALLRRALGLGADEAASAVNRLGEQLSGLIVGGHGQRA